MAFPETHPSLLRALTARGYTEPTPVQEAVLRPEAAHRDLLVSAQTGSGKTVAYGLSLAALLLGAAERFAVIAPTKTPGSMARYIRRYIWIPAIKI